jgi:hypothetical protein
MHGAARSHYNGHLGPIPLFSFLEIFDSKKIFRRVSGNLKQKKAMWSCASQFWVPVSHVGMGVRFCPSAAF